MTEWSQKQLLGKLRDSAKSINPVTGTTVDGVTEVVDLDTRQFSDTEFVISNTGSNSLYYKIRVRSEFDDGADFQVFQNEITGSDVDEAILVRHARVFVDVNSHVAGNHTTYEINCIGGT